MSSAPSRNLDKMIVSTDTSILFNALKDSQVRRTLHHLKNNKHEVVVPLTVAGELVMQGIQEGKMKQFYDIIDILKEIDATFLIPNPQLRLCCSCIDDYLDEKGTYGSSSTDRTHLAYSIANNCDYYVTTKSETRTLEIPKDCGTELGIKTIDEIRRIL